jgi:hypothetical protein
LSLAFSSTIILTQLSSRKRGVTSRKFINAQLGRE